MRRNEALAILAAHQEQLKNFGVKSLALFGSVARDEASTDSDVDLLVEFSQPVDLFEFVRLQQYLERMLGRPVDLGTPDCLKPQLREQVFKDIVLAMPPRDWKLRVENILQAIAEIQSFTEGMTFEDFQADTKTVRAVMCNITIMGETASSIPPEIQTRYPEMPWGEMRGIRNVIVHEYFQVNLNILWRTIQERLPPLVLQLRELLERIAEEPPTG